MDAIAQLTAALADRYTIDREIGRGGMATVYLARDIKHERRVAVKVLDPELGAVLGADRFLTEIRVTANLQHPNLLPLFDSGEANGLLYYVMPYVEGESLRHRLDRERELGVDETIRIATAIAGALDYAHSHGVIHRDLKPENILLQHGQPVVADFGIALAISKAGGQRVTQTGLSLGTPQYMSPEQATGDRVIDARSDIYSLGAVVYEMLAGEPPHAGSSAQATIAKLMTEPARPLTTLRPTVPEYVDDAVLRALEKVPADRFATAGEFAEAIVGGGTPRHHAATRTNASRRGAPRALVIGLVTACASALLFLGLWLRGTSRPDPKPIQFVVDLPSDVQVTTLNERAVALSPNGGALAYLARSRTTNIAQIFVRPLDSLQARSEAVNGMAPIFSSDGHWLYYKAVSAIQRVPVYGGTPEVVTPLTDWQGYAVSPRGEVAFAQGGSIWRVGDKGTHVRLVSPDSAKGEQSFADPSFLDDNTIGFWIQRSDDDPAKGTGITTMKGGEYSVLNLPGSRMFGMLDDYVLVGSEQGSLLAYPFNLRRRSVTGAPVVLLDSAVWIITGSLQISLADDGTLAYVRGKSGGSLAFVDKRGATIAEAAERATFGRAVLSPDGRRVAVAIARNTSGGRNVQTADVWVWDIAAKTMARFTTDGGLNPVWSADGKRIAFTHSTSPSHANIMWAPTDGSSPAELLVQIPDTLDVGAFSFARAGRELVINGRRTPSTNGDIYRADLSGTDRALQPLLATRFNEANGAVSPDGRWLAYTSNESGRAEVYVRPYATPAGRIRVSASGGAAPQWLASGSRLVYTDGGQGLVAEIAQAAGGAITATVRDSLSRAGQRQDVDATGARMVVVRTPADWRIVVVKNWVQEARRKLRAK
jgi:eukaryotic-like serine/threonine-protein kinase